jgi:hypothetical protein
MMSIVTLDHAPFGVLLAASLVIQPGRARSLCFHLGLTIHAIFCGCRGAIANASADGDNVALIKWTKSSVPIVVDHGVIAPFGLEEASAFIPQGSSLRRQ